MNTELDKEWLWQKYVVDGFGVTEIAKEMRIRTQPVNEALKSFGISKIDRKISKFPLLYSRAWMESKYLNEKLGAKEIANIFNTEGYKQDVTPTMVYEALEYLNIEKRKGYSPGLKYQELANKEWLYDQFIVQGKTVRQIAKELNSNYGSVIYAIMLFGLKKENYKNTVRMSKYPQLNDANWLHQKFIVEGMSLCAIADLVQTTHMNVKFACIKHKLIENWE